MDSINKKTGNIDKKMSNIDRPSGGNDGLESIIGNLSSEERKRLLEMLKRENRESPKELLNYRRMWREKIEYLGDFVFDDESGDYFHFDEKTGIGEEIDVVEETNKIINNIIKATENIPIRIKTDGDGGRLIEFILGGKTYKILDPNLEAHTDDQYKHNPNYNSSIIPTDDNVIISGMWGDDMDNWDNGKLREYVKEKQKEGLHIATAEEIREILQELGKLANLPSEGDQIAMLMYLTGIHGWYWLAMGDTMNAESERPLLWGTSEERFFTHRGKNSGSFGKILLFASK